MVAQSLLAAAEILQQPANGHAYVADVNVRMTYRLEMLLYALSQRTYGKLALKFISKFFIANVMVAGVITSVSAAPFTTLTFTTFGKVGWGFDGSGYFGAKGADLAGKSFSLTTSLGLPVDGMGDVCDNDTFSNCWAAPATVSTIIVIDGVSLTTNIATDEEASARIDNAASGNQNNGWDGISMSASGYSSSFGGYAIIDHYAGSYSSFVGHSNRFDLLLRREIRDGDWASVYVDFGAENERLIFGASTPTISGFIANGVPEPTSLGLAGIGFFGLLLLSRKTTPKS
ncbi:PEP-CTERM sorting domain-containing protein [Azohydromonas australica]|uniref:PEP-CTERM sorting domain-containing protein n=1 Tax=Azohydromonas australica TaxID=364039 RepID=UPI0009FF5031|nr:PEP-CTERM sorting domain-containing protein [Azohydromonas australica]